MKSKLEIILETEAAYANPENRATLTGSHNYCKYLTDDGRTCAVGRCMVAPQVDWCGVASTIVNAANILLPEPLDFYLKDEYKGHSAEEFWRSLQRWHDNIENFTYSEISDQGKASMVMLKIMYSTD